MIRISLLAIAVSMGFAWSSLAQETFYDRNEIPGTYTLGLYADENGRSNEIVLDKDVDRFEAWIGITGDSTKIFSALVCRIELPRGISIDGPVQWKPIHGLVQWGTPTGEGLQIEFNRECLQFNGITPVMAGRMRFKVDRDDFESGVIELQGHQKWGISVELCDPEHAWPKPYAEARHLTVMRKRSFWDRLRGLFG